MPKRKPKADPKAKPKRSWGEFGVERRTRALIDALAQLAELRQWTESDLQDAYREVIDRSSEAPPMRPDATTTYARLFRISHDSVGHYLGTYEESDADWSVRKFRTPPLRRIQPKHLRTIGKTLGYFQLYTTVPPNPPKFDRDRESQESFLKHAQEEVAAQIGRISEGAQVGSRVIDYGLRTEFHAQVAGLIEHYYVSKGPAVPFGGREAELERLNSWLTNDRTASRFFITSMAGRGKTALLLEWIKHLQDGSVPEGLPWQIAFMPISIRAGTNRPQVFFKELALQLSEISNQDIEGLEFRDEEGFKNAVREQLTYLAGGAHRVLVIIDGLDELLHGDFDATRIIPANLPSNIRVLLSARLQFGDVDPSGWVWRVHWDPNVLAGPPMELAALEAPGIRDMLSRLGPRPKALAKDETVVNRLKELTDGEPILLRFLAEDLAGRSPGGVLLTREDLDRMGRGFTSYFNHWVNALERAWQEEQVRLDSNDLWGALAVLAFAHGPLPSSDFLQLFAAIHHKQGIDTEHYLLKPLRRFVVGNGKAEHGYILCHPKIGEFLRNENFLAASKQLRLGFLAWGQSHLRALNAHEKGERDRAVSLPPEEASLYALQFLRKHFEEAAVSAAEWMELVENGWRLAWEHLDGGPHGFAGDVQAAWDAIRREGPMAEIGAQWRCVLVLSSIRSIGSNIPSPLLVAAVRNKVLSVRHARHIAEAFPSESECVRTLVQLGIETVSNPVQFAELISITLQNAASIHDVSERARSFHWLAPHLSAEQTIDVAGQVLAAIKGGGDAGKLADALGFIAPHLSLEQIGEAIAAANSIGDKSIRRLFLSQLTPYLSPEKVGELLTEAIAIASQDDRADSLRWLAPYLSSEHVGQAIAAGNTIGNALSRTLALGSLAQHLLAEQMSEILATVKTIGVSSCRSEILASLAPHLPPEQANEALAIAVAIYDRRNRVQALASLAKRLRPEQISQALTAAKATDWGNYPTDVWRLLAPLLSIEQIGQALATAKLMDEEHDRAEALGSLAPCLSPEQIGQALAAASAIRDERFRALALDWLAPHLSPKLIAEALAAAKSLHYQESRRLEHIPIRLNRGFPRSV